MRCLWRIVRILGAALLLWICLCQVQAAGAQTDTEDAEISVVQEELFGTDRIRGNPETGRWNSG